MGMFSYVCKGCGQELIEGELVRLNGCKGTYDGYGGAGGFEDDTGSVAAWHERCYKKATQQQRDDESPSKSAKNQGFGPAHLEFLPDFNPDNKTTYFVQLRGRTVADMQSQVKYRESMLLLTTRGWADAHVWEENHASETEDGPRPAGFEDVEDPHDIYRMFESLDEAISAGMARATAHDPDEFTLYVFGGQTVPELEDFAQGIVYEYERKEIVKFSYGEVPGHVRTGEYEEGMLYRIGSRLPELMQVPESSKFQLAQVLLQSGTPAQQKEAMEWLKHHDDPAIDPDAAHLAAIGASIKHLEGCLEQLKALAEKYEAQKKKAQASKKK